MAWTDLRGQSLGSIRDLLSLRNQRKQANADRMARMGEFAGSTLTGISEAEKDRQAALERIGATAEEQRATEAARYAPFEEPRTIIDPATGQEITLTSQADYDLAGNLFSGIRQERGIEAEAEAAALDWQNRFEAMDRESENRIKEMERELEITREVYENGSYQTQDGARFTWNTPEQYQAALSEIQEHTRKLSGLARDNPTAWEVYLEATDRAKEQMWEPYYDEDGMVRWQRTDVTQETLLENFVAELPMTGMDEDQIDDAIEAFRTYLVNAENAPPQEFSEAGDSTTVTVDNNTGPLVRPDTTTGTPAGVPPSPYTEEAEDVLGENPGLTRSILNLFGLSPREAMPTLEAGYYPEGITPGTRAGLFGRGEGSGKSTEQTLYDQLVALFRASDDDAEKQVIVDYMQTLVDEEKEAYPDIQSFLNRAVGRL